MEEKEEIDPQCAPELLEAFTCTGSRRRTDLLVSATVSCFYLRAAKSILPVFLVPPLLLETRSRSLSTSFPRCSKSLSPLLPPRGLILGRKSRSNSDIVCVAQRQKRENREREQKEEKSLAWRT